MMSRRIALFAVTGAALLMVGAAGFGCALAAGAAIGAGTVAYVRGDLVTAREASVESIYEASLAAMDELDFLVTDAARDQIGAEIEAETAQGKDITIEINRRSDEVTEFSIRVGLFGDEELSRLILDKIDAHLPG